MESDTLSLPLWKPNSMEINRMIFHCSHEKKRTHLDLSSLWVKLYIMYRKRISSLSRRDPLSAMYISALLGSSLHAVSTSACLLYPFIFKLEARFHLEHRNRFVSDINRHVEGTRLEIGGWVQLAMIEFSVGFSCTQSRNLGSIKKVRFIFQMSNWLPRTTSKK